MTQKNNTNNINKYNNFLKHLDNKNSKMDETPKPVKSNLDNYSLEKEVIDILTKMIEENYESQKLESTNFTGLIETESSISEKSVLIKPVSKPCS
jgi:hypothetical protein